MYIYYNNNPLGLHTGDCVIRALSVLLEQTWDQTYTDISVQGFVMGLMPSSNAVHQVYLEQHGYYITPVPSSCPQCITVREFADMYSKGRYMLAIGDHVVSVINGNYYDIFDSGDEIVAYFFSHKGGK